MIQREESHGVKSVADTDAGGKFQIRPSSADALAFSEKGISKSELIDNLYGWNEKQDMVNGNKNLNNLIYRLKKQLITLSRSSDSSAVLWSRSENYNSASCKVICICLPFCIFHVVSERTVLHIISVFFG